MSLEVQVEKKLPNFTLEASFTIRREPLGILGPSGAGKSMLLRCIAGLERPERGRILLNDRVLFDSKQGVQIPARERRIGLLFQHYALFPLKTVGENTAFGLHAAPDAFRRERVSEMLARVHLSGFEARYPRELSGGEQQRVALARALATEPEALLLDEPLSALDTHLRSQMEIQLQETFAAYQRPTLLVTHNMDEAYRLGEQLLVLSRGKVAAFGSKQEIFRHPPSLEVARLTGCKNFSRARFLSDHLVEALDWRCRLRVAGAAAKAPHHVAIRAHHLEFPEATTVADSRENTFACWLLRASETPFRMTLYLRLHREPGTTDPADLQAEIPKEKWERLRDRPFPWYVRFSPASIMVLPD